MHRGVFSDEVGPKVGRRDAQLRELLAMIGMAHDIAENFVESLVLRAALEEFDLPFRIVGLYIMSRATARCTQIFGHPGF